MQIDGYAQGGQGLEASPPAVVAGLVPRKGDPQRWEADTYVSRCPGLALVVARESSPVLRGVGPRPGAFSRGDENLHWRHEACRGPAGGDASRQMSDAY
jgi:hypothetical protein